SISVDTIACVTPRADNKIVVASVGYPQVEVDLNDLAPHEAEYGDSVALVRGVCAYFSEHNFAVGGFSATTTSDVFKGAGVSSSACFEVLVSEILNQMFNDGKIGKFDKVLASHHAESVFFGKPCGLLDQSAIAFGGVSYIDFKSTTAPIFESIDWNFENNCKIVLTNTGGDHSNLTSQYAVIRQEMEDVAAAFGKTKLREVCPTEFYKNIAKLQQSVSGRAILRAMHFYDENDRVVTAANAVKENNFDKFCDMINASGMSSYTMLQNCCPIGDTVQRIPLAINLSKKQDGVKAVRVHGGGFAGTIIAYIDGASVNNYVSMMKENFGEENVFVIGIRNDGACKINLK
ncbi:MAG: galactokinase, partial [Clostridia bacterium]